MLKDRYLHIDRYFISSILPCAYKNLYQEQRKLISGLIETGIRQGVLKKDLDPDLTALTFMALNDGILHHWVLNRSLLDGRQYVRTMRRIFFEGVLRQPENN